MSALIDRSEERPPAGAGPGLEEILSGYDRKRQNLIPILQAAQDRQGYLSKETLRRISDFLGVSANESYGVATFYTQFRFNPPGRHCVRICQGTACHVRGSGQIMDALSRKLGIAPGQTTDDLRFSLDRVVCVGSCALSPVVVIDDKTYGRMTAKKTEKRVEELAP